MFIPRLRSFLLIVLLYSAFTGRAQRVLVDSIEGELAVATLPAERMDLLLGLIRARVFYSGGDSAQPDVQRAIAYARKIADPTAEASAMIFGTQVDRDDPEQLFANSLNGIRVGQLYDDPSLEFFGRYHLIEDYLYDKNDVNKSKQLIDAALAARRPGIGHKQLGNLYKVIGIHYQGIGQVDSMLHYFHRALREFVDVGEDPDILPELGRAASTDWDRGVQNAAQVWLYLSRHYANQREYTRADSLVAAALAGAQRYDSPDLRAWALEEMGWLHRVSGRYGEAIEAYEEAYAIYDAMGGADRYLADISYRIGDLMVSSGNPAAAPPFFERSLRHHEYTTDTIGLKNALFVYGNAALRLGDLDLAARHLEKVLELNRHLRDTIHNGYLFNSLAEVAYRRHELELAGERYRLAGKINRRFNQFPHLIVSYSGLSNLYLEAGRLDSARYYHDLRAKTSAKYGDLGQRATTAYEAARLAEAEGDLAGALRQQRQVQILRDSLHNERSERSLRNAEVRQNVADYRAGQAAAQREAALLTQRNRLYFYLAAALLFLLAIGGVLLVKLRSARETLARQNTELTDLNADKDRFFGIIAHDLRSPIAALKTANMQINHYAAKEDIGKVLRVAENVDQAATGVNRLLDNLLSWALLQEGAIPYNPEPLDVAEVAEDVMTTYHPMADLKDILLDYEIAPQTVAFADSPSVHAILRNLVSNALKFTPRSGKVVISAGTEGDRVVVRVKDTGIGLTAEQLANLFTVQRGSSRGTAGEKGTGLGLILVRDLAELNRGTITVAAREGRGAVFTLTLPARS